MWWGDDVKKPTKTNLHKQLSLTVKTTAPLTSFVTTDAETDVTKAEMLFTHFLVEHNIPIAIADHARQLSKEMFGDSKVSSKYGCGRTKTTSIIGCLARNTQEQITIALRSAPFAVATDGSNDRNSDCSLYPIIVSYFNVVLGKIVTVHLALGTCSEGSTGVNIFTVVHNKRGILWHNYVAFCSDNASVMMGVHNGVVAHIVKQCACHLIHLAAQKAAGELPVDIEDFLVDVYYYLEKSTKRHQNLKKCRVLCGASTRKILKHVSTRWLSLGRCIDRLLEHWTPLEVFVESERNVPKAARVKLCRPCPSAYNYC